MTQGEMDMRRRRPYYCGKVKPIFGVFIFLLVGMLILFEVKLGPVVAEVARWQAQTIATKAVSRATEFALSHAEIGYDQLAVISRSQNGEVTSVQANMPKINALGVTVTEKIIEELEGLSAQNVAIPFGTLLDSQFLAGRGPKVSLFVYPTGSVEANIENRFESAGINQTLHRILLKLNIGIMGVLPWHTYKTTISTEICMAETVIIGAVPDYYTQIDGVESDLSGLVSDYGPGQIDIP